MLITFLSVPFKTGCMMKSFKSVLLIIIIGFIAASAGAETFDGGETHTVTEGDKIMTENGWGIEVDRIYDDSVSVTLISDGDDYYTTTLDVESSSDLTNGIRSTNEVISVTVQNIDSGTATIRADAIVEDETEEEEPPTPPGDDSETEQTETFEGDGTYILEPGDRIETDRGYTVELRPDQSWSENSGPVEVSLYDKEGDEVPLFDYRNYTLMSVGEGISKMDSRGLNVDALEVYPSNDSVKVRATSNMVIRLNEGWNLISSPLKEDSNIVRSTCGDTDELDFWGLDSSGKYFASGLTSTEGVWMEASEPCKIVVEGATFGRMDVELDEGWNIIGAPTDSIDYDAFYRTKCNVQSGPWGYRSTGYNSGYYEASELEAGNAYFLKVEESCNLDNMRVPRGVE